MRVELGQLKAFLADSELVNPEEFDKVCQEAEKKDREVGELLVAKGLVSQEQLSKLKAYILGIPFVKLKDKKIEPEILRIIPEPIARKQNIVAFRKRGKELEVAMLDPEDLRTIDFVKKAADLRVLPRLTDAESIQHVLQQYEKTLEAEFGDLIRKDAQEIKTISGPEEPEEEEEGVILSQKAQELPVVRIVDSLLKHAVLQRASDVHIEPTEKEVVVRYRIDGILHDAMVLPKQIASSVVARIKVLSNLKLDEHRLPQDGRFKIETESYRYSVRVSILPVAEGEKIVMRLLSETSRAFTLEELGLRGLALENIENNLRRPVGMSLVTGPTGSGKTTTLYSMLEILNSTQVNISTVEDPVEYRMPRVNQTQVRPNIGLTFSSALRSLLRQDPDVIMVGEIRDGETASLAINAALTGHVVLSTLHTNDAAGAIPRLIDMKAEPFLLSSTLNMIAAQRLVRKIHKKKEKYFLSKTDIKEIRKYCDPERVVELLKKRKAIKEGKSINEIPFYRVDAEEGENAYKGRIGIFEVLPVTETIKKMIVDRATAGRIREQARKEGMATMVEDGLCKAAQGITTIEEVLRVIVD